MGIMGFPVRVRPQNYTIKRFIRINAHKLSSQKNRSFALKQGDGLRMTTFEKDSILQNRDFKVRTACITLSEI